MAITGRALERLLKEDIIETVASVWRITLFIIRPVQKYNFSSMHKLVRSKVCVVIVVFE